MHDFIHGKFTERVIIFLNCPKGCKVTERPFVRGIMGR